MSKHLYIFSTLAAAVNYLNHEKGGADLPVPVGTGVLIKGGTGVADRNLVTPRGVMTEITAEELVYLEQNPVFQLHKRNGFITVEESNKDPERVVSEGMVPGDESRQLTTEDFTSGDDGEPKPSTADDGKSGKGNKSGKGK
jgi:hypothetical protein